MSPSTRSPEASDWRALADLGEQLVGTTSLVAQRDRIVSLTRKLVNGKVDVWLHEDIFRLPGWDDQSLFPSEPELDDMREAFRSRKTIIRSIAEGDEKNGNSIALPLEDQGVVLGVIRVTRDDSDDFIPDEIDLLEGLAGIVSVGLYASHRVAVEQLRLNQLNLVREVGAQISNVMDLDELASRVTKLIQETFHYYYVGIFTLNPESRNLRFRSDASSSRNGHLNTSLSLEVELGQGLIGQAANSGERIVVDDVREDERFRSVPGLAETRSEVVVPLKIEERVLGVLDVQHDQPGAFHPNDLLVLDALAANIARAVEGARLYYDLRRRADELALIAEVSNAVTSTLNLGEVLHQSAALIQEKFGYPFIHLFTVHPNRRQIVYEAGSGARSQKLEKYTISLDDPQGIIPMTARIGKTRLVNEVSQDEHYVLSPLPPRTTHSELCVPLIFDQQVVGILDIQSEEINAFTNDDCVLFEAVADTIATAIHNADLFTSEQWRRRVADNLREVAVLLSANVGVEQVLDAILETLSDTLPVDVSAIWLLEGGDLYLAAVRGCEPDELSAVRETSPEESVAMMQALISERPIIRRPDDAMWPSGIASGFEPVYSSIAAPLRVGAQAVGVLTLAHHTPGRYGHEALAMTTTFASYAAVAIENANLFDAAQEQAYASAALLQVAQAVVSLNDLDEIIGTIIRIMPILVGVDCCLLYLWNPDEDTFQPFEEYGLPQEKKYTFRERNYSVGDSPLLDAACQQGRLIAVSIKPEDSLRDWMMMDVDVETEKAELDGNDQLLFAVPLLIKSDIYGVLLALEAPGGLRFRARRLDIINGIAQQAALAIQNDRLQAEMVMRERLETEVQLARQIQETFIPETLPTYSGWDLAARWRTARQVGGDFYDVMELPGNRVGLFIADVADKGIPAALFMALTRTLVRAAVVENASPARALQRVNDLLIPDTHQGMFVTAVYAILDPTSGDLIYANSGHNPPVWVHHDGEVERLTRTSMALGVVESEIIEERSISLDSGDFLLFYTDGLSEAFSPDSDLFGEKRIITALQNNRNDTAEGLLQEIENQLDAFTGDEPPSDDMTMLLIHRL